MFKINDSECTKSNHDFHFSSQVTEISWLYADFFIFIYWDAPVFHDLLQHLLTFWQKENTGKISTCTSLNQTL